VVVDSSDLKTYEQNNEHFSIEYQVDKSYLEVYRYNSQDQVIDICTLERDFIAAN